MIHHCMLGIDRKTYNVSLTTVGEEERTLITIIGGDGRPCVIDHDVTWVRTLLRPARPASDAISEGDPFLSLLPLVVRQIVEFEDAARGPGCNPEQRLDAMFGAMKAAAKRLEEAVTKGQPLSTPPEAN